MPHAGQTRFNLPARLLGLCIAISGVLLAAPSFATAADTLSLGMEPVIPDEGDPFEMIASGNVDTPGSNGGPNSVVVYVASGTSGCATTAALEEANPDNLQPFMNPVLGSRVEQLGPFEFRDVVENVPGGTTENMTGNGLRTGHYRACGYLNGGNGTEGSPPKASARLPFTVGGTCDTASADVTAAEKALAKARKKLKAAKKSGDEAKIRKAKKAVKKAKKRLRAAEEDAAALCVS